jgi:hypothetical protein
MTSRAAPAPPLRFLGVVLAGWICLRAAMLAPGWWDRTGAPPLAPRLAAAIAAPPSSGAAVPTRPTASARPPPRRQGGMPAGNARASNARAGGRYLITPLPYKVGPSIPIGRDGSPAIALGAAGPSLRGAEPRRLEPVAGISEATFLPAAAARPTLAQADRWSGSAWLLARREQGQPALAPGGTLGGSQAGARVLYRVNGDPARPLALAGRLYVPLPRAAGAEAAAGIDWRPAARVPVHILAERRQTLGGEGRSAFALTLYGGISRPLPHGVRVDAYGQAGVVGVRARDLFADGSVRLAAPVGPAEVGGAAWGAAQPGAARLDAGPELSVRFHAGAAALRLSADWRFRIAGGAAPDSGPALTLATDF